MYSSPNKLFNFLQSCTGSRLVPYSSDEENQGFTVISPLANTQKQVFLVTLLYFNVERVILSRVQRKP